MKNGIDCVEEINFIKLEMDKIYQEKSKRKVDKMRGTVLDDQFYDIHKLQNERKYENQKKIDEINIGGHIFSGTENVVMAIQGQIRLELETHRDLDFSAPPTRDEEVFLNKISQMELSEEERNEIISPIKENEIAQILQHEVDKVSSPGEDSLTYRFITIFWNWSEFRFLFIKYLNFA